MNRIDRLLETITILQSGRGTRAEWLAQKFGISERTVYRDLSALSEIGIPVTFEADRGYYLVEGFFLPPITFTHDEGRALLVLGALASRYGDADMRRHFESALRKLRTVMDSRGKEMLSELEQSVRIHPEAGSHSGAGYLSSMERALREKQILEIRYQNRQGIESKREVEPIGITFYGSSWHLVAWCHLRQAYRDFRFVAIEAMKPSGKPFAKTDHIPLDEYIRNLE